MTQLATVVVLIGGVAAIASLVIWLARPKCKHESARRFQVPGGVAAFECDLCHEIVWSDQP